MSKTSAHQKNYNLNAEQTNNASSLLQFLAACGGTTTLKRCGTSTVLTADYNPSGYYLWNTAPTQKSRSITVTSSGTYSWETLDMVNNLVKNGDFSLGDNGNFTSNYVSVTSPTSACTSNCTNVLGPEGRYSISTNPNFTHTAFQSMGDNTSGTGNMMVVNGGASSTSYIWRENINVTANTIYVFSVWFASVTPDNPGQLKFSIGNSALNNNAIVLSSTVGLWQNFTLKWTAPSTAAVNISIVNQNTVASGNDFALDDVYFAPVCLNSIDLTLTPYPTKPSITPL